MNRICFIKWTGSKLRVVGTLYSLFPDTKVYYEPFLGSGAVLINKYRTGKEIANDLDAELYTLHKVMADEGKMIELFRQLNGLDNNKTTFEEAVSALEKYKNGEVTLSEVDIARCKYVKVQLSFNGMGRYYSKDADLSIDEEKFERIWKRYQGVEFRNMDGIQLIEEMKDNPDAFVFADPPYVQKLRGNKKIYECEMGDDIQKKLLTTIRDAKCKIMLCGYRDESKDALYDNELFPYGWYRYKLADLPQGCQIISQGEKRQVAEEFIWVNYELPVCAEYCIPISSRMGLQHKLAS